MPPTAQLMARVKMHLAHLKPTKMATITGTQPPQSVDDTKQKGAQIIIVTEVDLSPTSPRSSLELPSSVQLAPQEQAPSLDHTTSQHTTSSTTAEVELSESTPSPSLELPSSSFLTLEEPAPSTDHTTSQNATSSNITEVELPSSTSRTSLERPPSIHLTPTNGLPSTDGSTLQRPRSTLRPCLKRPKKSLTWNDASLLTILSFNSDSTISPNPALPNPALITPRSCLRLQPPRTPKALMWKDAALLAIHTITRDDSETGFTKEEAAAWHANWACPPSPARGASSPLHFSSFLVPALTSAQDIHRSINLSEKTCHGMCGSAKITFLREEEFRRQEAIEDASLAVWRKQREEREAAWRAKRSEIVWEDEDE